MADAGLEDFESVLRYLRGIATTCEPPVGVGSFDLLYATETEVVVWYSPAREHQQAGEVTIAGSYLSAAWSALLSGEPLDIAALDALGHSPVAGRWLLALLAQLPGVRVLDEPLAVTWASEESALPATPDVTMQSRTRRGSGYA